MILLHELGHAHTWLTDRELHDSKYALLNVWKSNRWSNPDEEHVIKTLDNVALEKLGLEPRISHKGDFFNVKCPTCTE